MLHFYSLLSYLYAVVVCGTSMPLTGALVLAPPPDLIAQTGPDRSGPPSRDAHGVHEANDPDLNRKRERVRQRIRTIREAKLRRELNLDERTAAKLFPVLNRYDAEFEKLMRTGKRLHRTMRTMLEKGASPAELNEIIDQMLAHQRQRGELQQARFQAVRKVLTPTQTAKILVVLPRIDHQIRRKIWRAKRGSDRDHPGRRGRGHKWKGPPPLDGPGGDW